MRTLLVTGANSEIGAAYLREKGEGYGRIIAHYKTRHDRIDALVERLGDKVVPVYADLSKPGDIDRLLAQLEGFQLDEFLHIAAPKFRYTRFAKADIGEFELEMGVVYWSFLRICQKAIPGMAKRGHGKILSILTEYTVTNQPPYMSHYISTKYALLGLIKSLASEYAAKHIRINAISPGMVETGFLSQVPQYVIDANAKEALNKKNLCPADLVPAICFLLSNESDAITGQNILLQ